MLSYCQLDPIETVKLQSRYKIFNSRKCIWKYRLRNGSHFVQREMSISFRFNSLFAHLVPYKHQRQVPNILEIIHIGTLIRTHTQTHTRAHTHGCLHHTSNCSSRNKYYSIYMLSRLLLWRTYIIYHILYFFTGEFSNFPILFTDIK